jgi:hypothetical protein
MITIQQPLNITKMANIQIKTTGVRGGIPKLETKGEVVLFIDNAKAGNYISVDAYMGRGEGYQQREDTLIEIRQDFKVLFSGTKKELLTKLKS